MKPSNQPKEKDVSLFKKDSGDVAEQLKKIAEHLDFLEKKMIREVIVDPSKVFYDPNTCPHHHFYNTATGELTDIDVEEIGLTGLPPLPPGMMTEGVDIIVRVRPSA
jgi:Fe2+ or Zn2+ uptake regulation protein